MLKMTAIFSANWNVDESIEDLWVRIHDFQALAPASAPIDDGTVIHLTLGAFERSGVFTLATGKWCDKALPDPTLDDKFKRLFTFENKERNTASSALPRLLVAAQAGERTRVLKLPGDERWNDDDFGEEKHFIR
jgi:hypothetical protein